MKEVERLKKNREERRAKQQEIMEEKEKAIEMNANHANYDFFCMIQDYQEQLEYNPLTEEDPIMDHQVSRTQYFHSGIQSNFHIFPQCRLRYTVIRISQLLILMHCSTATVLLSP